MPCKHANIIAIDGPAGSGKSTVAKGLADRLGLLYVDTGAMYRALTLKAVNEGINFKDEKALVGLAGRTDIQLKMQGDALKVVLDGEDVSRAIREQSVTNKVRYLAGIKGVRREMVRLQRSLADSAQGAVLEGRDIGTVVFPRAKYKFYLDAKKGERAKRRYKDLRKMGQRIKMQDIADDLNRRDRSDMERSVAPLVKARDAVYIDTTELTVAQVVEKISERCSIL
jgi:cytidylate kinase